MFVGWQVMAPLLKLVCSWAVLRRFDVTGVRLRALIDFNIDALFLGLAVVVLGQVMVQAAELERDRSLTI